ncbi:MAG: thiamine phosphate synthase [Candidatus Rokubacteria bacterium]|nr:thiamine phosphate synthase [Candidatus Rokubacteria bacterium]
MDELGFSLYLVTDRAAPRPRPLVVAVESCLAAGLRAVQLREKDLPVAALLELGHALRQATARHGARLIVNDRADVALAVDADGVQRTHASLPVPALRAVVGAARLVGASVHSPEEARAATGANFLVFGPVYDTPSKREYGPPQGLERLRDVCASVGVPVLAIGGVTPARVGPVLAAGARGVAVISAILADERPADRTRAFLDALGHA